ncbi:two-component sensor histidine kinase [Streptacidiphilus pinicola]|uniref:histidine kinase n=1 Tax=Streptacidiphilus pinicola TaxID=2219663 RepID=A0A2X0JYU1_9ACTN|nr:sensor histidine kinase [Streptacidiphilus pinicola]RAG82115.1 two-component sensor histidine kinase [Streptacidiphilus pinicola]
MDLLRRLRLFVRAHPYWADALLAAVLYLVTILWPTGGRPSTQWSNFDPDEVLLVAGLCVYAPLALRRRYPVLVLACTVAATVGYMFVGPVRGPILAGSGLAIYTVSSVVERRLALAIGGVAVLSVGIASMALSPEKWDEGVNGIAFAWTAMTVAVGESVRSRRAFVAAIEERALRAEHTREEEARRRVAEERLRIARELHDIVGHHIALINIQAGVASTVLDSQPDTARAALAQVREAGRAALSELGATVAVLRQTGEGEEAASPRDPAPGLAQLAQLVDSFERSGLRVECRTEGAPVPIPAAVDLTAYRVVQESLTNVRKHAGASAASVRLEYRPGVLHIEVDDDGPGPKPPAKGGASASGGTSGFGLIGMRERAASVGGTFAAGPRPDGGFRVTLDLPLGGAGRSAASPTAADASRGPGLPRMNLPNLLGPFRPVHDTAGDPSAPDGVSTADSAQVARASARGTGDV